MLWRSGILIINSCLRSGLGSALSKRSCCHSLSSSAFRVKCILPSQSSSRFTTECLQDLLSAEVGISHPVAPYANVLPSLGYQSQELEFRLLEMPVCVCHPRPKTATGLLWGHVSQQTVFLQVCGFTGHIGALGAASFGGDQSLRLHHFTFLITPPPAIC